jgi:hypothetical protein
VTQSHLIADLIANGHRAQIIHQGGLLIYANTAAARVFGFKTIAEFARFAKAASLFGDKEVLGKEPKRRMINFVHVDGQPKCAHVREQTVDWNGVVSTLLEVAMVEAEQTVGDRAQHNESFVPDTISSAMDWTRLDTDHLDVIRKPFDAAGVVFPRALCRGRLCSFEC